MALQYKCDYLMKNIQDLLLLVVDASMLNVQL